MFTIGYLATLADTPPIDCCAHEREDLIPSSSSVEKGTASARAGA